MSTLEKTRMVSPVLTELARGYKNAKLIGHVLYPVIKHDKEAGKIPQFGKESFKEYNTERAIRGKSNRLNPEDLEPIDFVMTEHDIEYPIDGREKKESATIQNKEVTGAKVTQKVIQLRHERMCAELAQDDTKYPVGNKVVLSSSDKFDAYDTSDPIKIISDAKEAVRSKIGIEPNTLVLGAKAFNALKSHPKILARIQHTELGVVKVDHLKSILDIEKIEIGRAITADDNDNVYDIWKDNAILAYVPDNPKTADEPSYGYTLEHKDTPVVDTYSDNGGKVSIVRNTNIFTVKTVGPDAGYLIKGTNL